MMEKLQWRKFYDKERLAAVKAAEEKWNINGCGTLCVSFLCRFRGGNPLYRGNVDGAVQSASETGAVQSACKIGGRRIGSGTSKIYQ